MPASATAEVCSGMYVAEDWQAQLEELLALQSIFAEDFRYACCIVASCLQHKTVSATKRWPASIHAVLATPMQQSADHPMQQRTCHCMLPLMQGQCETLHSSMITGTAPVVCHIAVISCSCCPVLLLACCSWLEGLQSVTALVACRVTHIPGQSQASSISDTEDAVHSSRNRTSSDSSTGDCCSDVGQHLESLIGSSPPMTSDGLLTCEAIVQVELPSGQLQILLDMQQQHHQSMQGHQLPGSSSSSHSGGPAHSSGTRNNSSSTAVMPIGSPISWLPPFLVQLTLPYSYPSSETAPPRIALQACWLSGQQADQLQQHLQQLWEEQGPGQICFAWLDFLKNDALAALGIVEELVLQPQQAQQQQEQSQQLGLKHVHQNIQQNSVQQQTQQLSSSMEDVAVQLLRYSTAQEAEAFRESMQTCSICFEQVRSLYSCLSVCMFPAVAKSSDCIQGAWSQFMHRQPWLLASLILCGLTYRWFIVPRCCLLCCDSEGLLSPLL